MIDNETTALPHWATSQQCQKSKSLRQGLRCASSPFLARLPPSPEAEPPGTGTRARCTANPTPQVMRHTTEPHPKGLPGGTSGLHPTPVLLVPDSWRRQQSAWQKSGTIPKVQTMGTERKNSNLGKSFSSSPMEPTANFCFSSTHYSNFSIQNVNYLLCTSTVFGAVWFN